MVKMTTGIFLHIHVFGGIKAIVDGVIETHFRVVNIGGYDKPIHDKDLTFYPADAKDPDEAEVIRRNYYTVPEFLKGMDASEIMEYFHKRYTIERRTDIYEHLNRAKIRVATLHISKNISYELLKKRVIHKGHTHYQVNTPGVYRRL